MEEGIQDMSVDIDWETLTQGPDGIRLAETIRDFVHERFQHIPLPRLIRSVKCQSFDFGTVAPQVVLKDICDPLPDFYEDDEEPDDEQSSERDHDRATPVEKVTEHLRSAVGGLRQAPAIASLGPLSRGATTPGILGGTSNLGYFQLPLSGLSGTSTPLAAVAGAQFQYGSQVTHSNMARHHAESFSSISPPPPATPTSRPTSRDHSSYFDRQPHASAVPDGPASRTIPASDHEVSPEDLQVVFHATYSGDVKLSLTAEVFLDYPMPSFVGIPLKLNITGMTFDGVGIVAYIKKKAHLCFLAPDDAEALIGGETLLGSPGTRDERPNRVGALLEDIKFETEMGGADSGRQVLKNVGKIEKFVLEQVQRIFEDEFVYPSYLTFLV
ncbi:Mitochondrial distribution and morphology protein 12 [Friedmanniomyces endolithicus]|nr:Mitochondrial distribution and morphology protein 12 [Friedmanniomyces endolithicus]